MRIHLLLSAHNPEGEQAMIGLILWPWSDWITFTIESDDRGTVAHFGPFLVATRKAER